MSHYEHSGSEEGQLKSNGDQSGDDDHGTDSLDIKPPQPMHHRGDNIRRRSGKDKKHSKDRKHKDRHRDKHAEIENKSRSHDKEQRYDKNAMHFDDESFGERRHKYYDKSGGAAGGISGNFNKKDSVERKNMRGREYFDRDYEYYNRHKMGTTNSGGGSGGVVQRERDKAQISDRQFLQIERRKYEPLYDYKQDAETLEQDLRSRLLSKRNKYAKEYQRYDEHSGYKKQQPNQWPQQTQDHRERTENREREYHENKLREVTFVIDSPEHIDDYRNKKRQKRKEKHRRSANEKHSHSESKRDLDEKYEDIDSDPAAEPLNIFAIETEDPEQAARKAKLLDAEREMARRKELAREELEARRELRRERGETTPEPTKAKKRHFQSDEDEKKVSRTKIKKIQHRTQKVDEKLSAISDPSDISTEEDDMDSSSSEKSKRSSRSADNDELTRPESSLSIVEILASPENRRKSSSRSQSRSVTSHRSRSDSHSHNSRSLSRSKSRSRSRDSDRSLSIRTGSRSRSASRNSRSHSKSRSKERFITNAKKNNEVVAEEEMKVSEEKVKKEDAEKESQETSPRNENGEKLPNYYPGIQGCRSVEEFQRLNRIEEGTYGVVYRAKDKRTNEIVAVKRLKMEKEKEGFPITSLREINTLIKGQHPNIVTVREIVVGSNMDNMNIFIVMDYVEHDLKSLMEIMKNRDQFFFPGEVKCLIQQLLRAVGHLHDNWILHRDLKTTNLLLSHKGILKVGDFGLAREYGSPLKQYTSLVVTLWYRAPELLLCAKEYSTPIDMWSVGCIFAEFLQMETMFFGNSEIDQLNQIFKNLGTPNEKIWPGYKDLPAVQNLLTRNSQFTEYPVSNLKKKFMKKTTEMGVGLLQGLFTYDPKQRLSAEQALKHPYFKELPLPIDPSMFPTWPAKSEVGLNKAMMMSPKPPPGGSQYNKLRNDENRATKSSVPSSSGMSSAAMRKKVSNNTGFVLNSGAEQRQLAMGPGFNLKF